MRWNQYEILADKNEPKLEFPGFPNHIVAFVV